MRAIFDLKSDINDVLWEFGLPEFHLLNKIKNVDDMVSRIVEGYHKEVRIQMVWGGIRNPAGVLQNKIRHELTNYDKVRDALTDALNNGMDRNLVIDIREELMNMAYQMVACIIGILPPVIEVKDSHRGLVQINRKQLHKANEGYMNRELKQLMIDKRKVHS